MVLMRKWRRIAPALPVTVPLLFLVFLTAGMRIATQFKSSQSGKMTSAHSREKSNPNRMNSTEKIFVDYRQVTDLLAQGKDSAALCLLHSLESTPITVDGNTFQDTQISAFSPNSLLLNLGHMLVQRAEFLATTGDQEAAREYIDALYNLGDRLLTSPSPTVGGLEVAHNCYGFAAQAQSVIFAHTDHASKTAAYQLLALRTLWQKKISPQLLAHGTETLSTTDKEFAARLSQEYRDGCSRIRAGES